MPYTPNELDKITRPSWQDIVRATTKIVKTTFSSHESDNIEPLDLEEIENKFHRADDELATREALAKTPGIPQDIQAVNKALIKAGVTLHENNLVRLLRRAQILTYPIPSTGWFFERFVLRARRETKFIKNELGLSEGFDESAKRALENLVERARQGEDITPVALEKCKTQRTFDETGALVHKSCAFFAATFSEFAAVQNEFSIGAESDSRKAKL